MPANPPVAEEAVALSAADVAFFQSAVSILASAQGPDRQPVMARAIGVSVEPDTGRVRMVLRDDDAADLMAGARAHDRVAVMLSRPSTNETMQLKGDRVAVEPTNAEDDAVRRRYLPAMIGELMPLGFSAELIGCVMSDHGGPTSVLSFRPTQQFDQTPGPGAGRCRGIPQPVR